MITTVTLNVAVDKAYVVDHLKAGKVMRVLTCTNTPGGKGLNVARVIRECKEAVLATGIAGGYHGAYVEELLRKQQVDCDFLHTKTETRTCINVLAGDGSSTEFLEAGDALSEDDCHEFIRKFDGIIDKSDVITISGSVPQGVKKDIYAVLIQRIKQKGKRVILDTSGELLKEGIKAMPTMIKPNQEEIEALLGISVNHREDLIEGAGRLQKMGMEYVVVSLGANGAVVVTGNAVYHAVPPKITPVNTVGSGDAMVGAFAVGFVRGYSIWEALKYAVSVSAANTLTMTTGSFREEDRKRIFDQVTVTKL